MNNHELVIETKALTKTYGKGHNKKTAVNRLSLKVPKGCVYGFLGPNGAGKSTTMKMLLGLIKPTGGEISVLGEELFGEKNGPAKEAQRLAVLRQTGSLIETPSYYGHLTGRENLEILCTLKGVSQKEISEVLTIVRMEGQQHKKAAHYSLGMKQRLALAGALLGHPALLLLDEPTNGLDPAGIQEIRGLIRTLARERQMTILVSSHLLTEIQQMADYVGIINRGELIYQDSLQSLWTHSRPRLYLRSTDNARALRLLNERAPFSSLDGDFLSITEVSDEETAFLVSSLVKEGIGILRLEERQKNLEDIFLSLTGKEASL